MCSLMGKSIAVFQKSCLSIHVFFLAKNAKICFLKKNGLGKGLTSWLSFVVSSVSLSLSHWYPGSGVVLDCIDS